MISHEVPLIVPDTVRLSPAPLMKPVLRMTKFSLQLIGAIELLAKLCAQAQLVPIFRMGGSVLTSPVSPSLCKLARTVAAAPLRVIAK